MNFKTILVEPVEDGVCILTLNRPQVLNAISIDVKRELDEALTVIEKNAEVRALVVTGSGEKAFSAGGDIKELVTLTEEELKFRKQLSIDFIWHMANFKVPTIGAINGIAYGGGPMLATALDIRIGCGRTKFRFLAAQYGRLNSTWTLPLVVGWARAKELVYTARTVEAEEAASIGLLNRVVTSDQLIETAIGMGRQIAKNVPECVQSAKQLFHQNLGRSWKKMQLAEESMMASGFKPGSFEESFSDFLSRKGRK